MLPFSFYRRDTVEVARGLLGMRLVRMHRGQRLSGIIVETEAYLGAGDRAAHTFGGRATERVRSMYLAGGHAYVYQIYGMHYCLNVVTRLAGEPEAVLIRALEPESGIVFPTNGPGKLCKAMMIDKKLDGVSLRGAELFLERTKKLPSAEEILAGPRIGVDYAEEAAGWPLRFTWRGNAHLSRKEKRSK